MESDPIPQSTSPNEAIHRLWAKMRVRHPIIVIAFEIRNEVLLPKLSAKIAITKQPINVPKYGALE
jgi:hypothetical protein